MANLYISEYANTPKVSGNNPIQAGSEPSVATQKVAFTTSTASAAFQDSTILVRLTADADVNLVFGDAPTATAASMLLKADTVEYFGVNPRQKVAAYDGSS